MTAQQIAQMVDGDLIGSTDVVLTGAAPIDEAGPEDVAFVAEKKYFKSLKQSRAGCVIAGRDAPHVDQLTMIIVDHPRLAFAKVLGALQPRSTTPPGIHDSAVIGEDVTIGEAVTIGPRVVIGSHTSIGDGVSIGAGTVIGERCDIGKESVIHANVTVGDMTSVGRSVILHPGCVIGGDGFGYVTEGDVHHKVPHIGRVVIEDDVEIGANTTIDRGTCGKTVIGQGTKIDNLVMIAHNVQIGAGCLIVAQSGISGSARIGDRVTFAGQSGTVGHISVGDDSVILARGVVTGDLPAGSVVSGFPARAHAEQIRVIAATRRLPEIVQTATTLKKMTADLQQRIEILEDESPAGPLPSGDEFSRNV